MAQPKVGVRLTPRKAGPEVDTWPAGRATPRGVVRRAPGLAPAMSGTETPSVTPEVGQEEAAGQAATVAAGEPVGRQAPRAAPIRRITVVVAFLGTRRVEAVLKTTEVEVMTTEGSARDPMAAATKGLLVGVQAPVARGAVGGVRSPTVVPVATLGPVRRRRLRGRATCAPHGPEASRAPRSFQARPRGLPSGEGSGTSAASWAKGTGGGVAAIRASAPEAPARRPGPLLLPIYLRGRCVRPSGKTGLGPA